MIYTKCKLQRFNPDFTVHLFHILATHICRDNIKSPSLHIQEVMHPISSYLQKVFIHLHDSDLLNISSAKPIFTYEFRINTH